MWKLHIREKSWKRLGQISFSEYFWFQTQEWMQALRVAICNPVWSTNNILEVSLQEQKGKKQYLYCRKLSDINFPEKQISPMGQPLACQRAANPRRVWAQAQAYENPEPSLPCESPSRVQARVQEVDLVPRGNRTGPEAGRSEGRKAETAVWPWNLWGRGRVTPTPISAQALL